jgi:osmotically-inducible protein OsmY
MTENNRYQDGTENTNQHKNRQAGQERMENNNDWNRNRQVNYNQQSWQDEANRTDQPYGRRPVHYTPDHDDRYNAGFQQDQNNDYRYGMQQPYDGQGQSWGQGNRSRQQYDEFQQSGFHAGYQQSYPENRYGDYEGRNYNDPRYAEDEDNRNRNSRDRGAWKKTRDEVSSWFGDDEAERRREQDHIRGEHSGKGPRGYQRSKERIHEDVCDRLTVDDRVDASEIDVSVEDNEVILSGTVTSKEEKRRAEDLAESIVGVRNVENRIKVVRPGVGTTETMNTVIRKTGNMEE